MNEHLGAPPTSQLGQSTDEGELCLEREARLGLVHDEEAFAAEPAGLHEGEEGLPMAEPVERRIAGVGVGGRRIEVAHQRVHRLGANEVSPPAAAWPSDDLQRLVQG